MSQAASVPLPVIRAMKFILRSPLHALLSKTILLISFTGCKSGKTYTTPVSYSLSGSQVSIFTHARWWKNLRGGQAVNLRIRGRELQGLAEPEVNDKQKIADALSLHLRRVRSDAPWYGVSFDRQGNPDAADIQKAVQSVVMIRVQLTTPPAI